MALCSAIITVRERDGDGVETWKLDWIEGSSFESVAKFFATEEQVPHEDVAKLLHEFEVGGAAKYPYFSRGEKNSLDGSGKSMLLSGPLSKKASWKKHKAFFTRNKTGTTKSLDACRTCGVSKSKLEAWYVQTRGGKSYPRGTQCRDCEYKRRFPLKPPPLPVQKRSKKEKVE
ncbi:unnamed protein product [Cladocopium goreaui]|uniref:Uncharacterized protein n=1 Tax=Cladocopium goreaui TaxID=2562237 RepID=A0A9P1DHU5_9DINO|nr:unnamed protein product [Cladocopium goreaui]